MANGSLLGRILVKLGLDSSEFKKGSESAKKELQKIPKEAQESASKIKSAFSGLGGILAGVFSVTAITGFIKSMVQVRSEISAMQTSLETLLGSKYKASAMFKELRDFASNTPMQLNDLAKGAQTILQFGIASEKVVPILRALGDISMADAGKFQSLTLAFSQMSSTGKLMGQDLLQMINAGFNPLEEISRKTGISIAQLKEQMSKGAISAQEVTEAFISATSEGGRFYGMLENMSKTMKGSLSNLSSAWSDMLNDMGASTENFMTYIVQVATSAVKKVSQLFQWGTIDNAMADKLKKFYDSNFEIVKKLGEGNGNTGLEGFQFIDEQIKELENRISASNTSLNNIIQDDNGKLVAGLQVGDLLREYRSRIEALKRMKVEYEQYLQDLVDAETKAGLDTGNKNKNQDADTTPVVKNEVDALEEYFSKSFANTIKSFSSAVSKVELPQIEDLSDYIEIGSLKDFENQMNLIADAMNNCNITTEAGRQRYKELGDQLKELSLQSEEFKGKVEEIGAISKVVEVDLTQSIQSLADQGIRGLGDALSQLFSGDLEGALAALLRPIANTLAELGSMLILEGIGIEAFKSSLTSLNGIAAIAAGTALLALSAGLTAAIKGLGADAGGTGTSYNTYTGGYSSQGAYSSNNIVAQTSSNVVVLTTKVSGSDLLLVQERESSRRGR